MISTSEKRWTRGEAFKHFGCAPKNNQWSWSARSPDGDRVSITTWVNQISLGDDGQLVYVQEFGPQHHDQLGYSEWIENISHAVEKLGGIIYPVRAFKKDVNSAKAEIDRCSPWDGRRLRVTSFEVTQERTRMTAEILVQM